MSEQKCAHFHLDHLDKRITITWQTSPAQKVRFYIGVIGDVDDHLGEVFNHWNIILKFKHYSPSKLVLLFATFDFISD